MPSGIYVRTKPVSQETRNKMSINRKGKKHTEEAKIKISIAHKGRKHSAEIRKRMGIAHIGILKGVKFSKEHCLKISKALKGRIYSKETIQKMSLAKLNKPCKGGICYKRGYKFIFVPNHPYAVNKYVKNSRLVMEKIIGRYLLPSEHIHHINEDRNDDRPENLKIFNLSEHMRYHRLLNPIKRTKKIVTQIPSQVCLK